MLKNIQIKIILAFSIIGLIVITAFGLTYIYNLENTKLQIHDNMELSELKNLLNSQIYESKIIMIIFIIVFLFFMVLMGIIVAKVVISPISELIKSAERATKSERKKYLNNGNKKKNEINDLVSAFDSMNNELKENLNEVTRQKKQIETILLHMTDGIIAFNIEGKVIHINNAAKTFLKIHKEETFEEIFQKYNLDINLEKVIYLENWASSEKKLNLEENIRAENLSIQDFANIAQTTIEKSKYRKEEH